MGNGFVKVPRDMETWFEWYQDIVTRGVYLWLVMKACYSERRYKGMDLLQGQLHTTINQIAVGNGISVRQARTAIERLEDGNYLTTKRQTNGTLVTVEKYAEIFIQGNSNDKRMTNERQTNDKPKEREKREKKNIYIYSNARAYGTAQNVILTDEQVEKLKANVPEYLDLIEELSLYMGSFGKTYKDHYLTILNWHRRRNGTNKSNSTTTAGNQREHETSSAADKIKRR